MKNDNKLDFIRYFSVIRIFVAIGLSLLVVFVVIFFVSDNPLYAIQKMILGPLQTKRSFFNVLERATPLIFTGLALNVSLRSGVFNLAADSSFYMGAVLAAFVSIKLPLAAGFYQLTYMVVAIIAGGLINTIPVVLNKHTRIDPTVVSIMQNYVFYFFGISLVSAFLLAKSGTWGSALFPVEAKLGNMITGTSLHWGVLIMLVVIVITVVIMEKTGFGYKVRVTGTNSNFAKNSGIKTERIILEAQFIGGAVAGLGGAVEMMGMYKRFQWQTQVSYVWDGLMVHMLANQNPIFIPLTAFFIAYLRIGAEIMSRSAGIDPEVVAFLQGIVILLVASDKFLYAIKRRYEHRRALAQAACATDGERGGVMGV